MTPSSPATAKRSTSMDPLRKTSLTAGALYLLTFVSIPSLLLYESVHETGYITGPGPDTAVLVGGILEFIVALACIGTAVVLYGVVKRQNEALALGLVGARVLEAAVILAGVACLFTVVTLRQAGAGPEALVIGESLVGLYDRLFFLGQGMMPIANALLLGTLLYRSRLVPRALPLLGFIGVPLLLASNMAILFGVIDRISTPAAIAVIPIAAWEFSLGVYLIVKGFRPEGVARLYPAPRAPHPRPDPVPL
jgi:hypothetical protein